MSDPQSQIQALQARVAELEAALKKTSLEESAEAKKRTEGTRMTTSTGATIGQDEGHLGGEYAIKENPEFIGERLALYEVLKAKREEEAKLQPREPITITLPNGSSVQGTSFVTTPLEVAQGIAASLAKAVLVAKVIHTRRVGNTVKVADSSGFEVDNANPAETTVDKGELWDLVRPLEGDCKLELLKFDEREAKMVFWHSSAHILGECIECNLGSHLTVGPPVDPGFYYDTYLGGHGLTPEMTKKLEDKAKVVIKEKQAFERIVLTKEEALQLFKRNPYKVSIIKNKIADGSMTTAYRCGPLIDLCMGPHIPNTGLVKAFEVTKASTSYWLGNVANDPLQRVYGISFPDTKMMTEHKKFLEEASENDHRRRGEQQKLFFFHPFSPGCAFFLPHGSRIYTTLTKFIRDEYVKRGYSEVQTPNIFNAKLWMQSGHWEHYREDMFTFADHDKEIFSLKPMNCPGHCLLFNHTRKSYRELPLRIADFGVLHRNEASGALTGLTRVRRFQQDDAHIFCSMAQLEKELMDALDFMRHVYTIFGMSYKVERSTRPAKACGARLADGSPDVEGLARWDRAEAILAKVLNDFAGAGNWRDNPGDGAFYGPKIDIKVFDSMKRIHQCATIQLDFQNPINFDLHFDNEHGVKEAPVMIHRAMLGSLERMIAVLTEHFKGKWPFWLSPRQCIVICVHPDFQAFAKQLHAEIQGAGFFCDIDLSTRTLKKQLRDAQIEQYNFMLVVGRNECTLGGADVRMRSGSRAGFRKTEEIIGMFREYADSKCLVAEPECSAAESSADMEQEAE